MTYQVLHIEDDPIVVDAVRQELEGKATAPIVVESISNHEKALKAIADISRDLILLDLHLTDNVEPEGIALLKEIKKLHPHLPVIIYSSDMQSLRETMRFGADDFIFKSSRMEEFGLRVNHFLESRCRPNDKKIHSDQFAGQLMTDIFNRMLKISSSSVRSVYVSGETGTGKEAVADTLEKCLPPGVPFVRINCAAITPSLMESELFGHVKGAFTGAQKDRRGYFEAAQNGWLFLDEVTCLPETTQAKLLRAIENQEITRVGESTVRKVSVKIISASNESMEDLISAGKFRKDLWNRINETIVELKPLRHRKEEIPSIIDFLCQKEEGGPFRVSEEAKKLLAGADWEKGNIRELRSCLRAMTAYHVDKMLVPSGLPDWFWDAYKDDSENREQSHDLPDKSLQINFSQGYESATEELLVVMMRELSKQPGNHSLRKMADNLKLPKSTLANKIRKCVDHGVITEDEIQKIWPK